MEPIYQNLGSRVRTLRLASKWTQSQLATITGLTAGIVSNIERAQQRSYLHVVKTIADVFHVTLLDLVAEPAATPATPAPVPMVIGDKPIEFH